MQCSIFSRKLLTHVVSHALRKAKFHIILNVYVWPLFLFLICMCGASMLHGGDLILYYLSTSTGCHKCTVKHIYNIRTAGRTMLAICQLPLGPVLGDQSRGITHGQVHSWVVVQGFCVGEKMFWDVEETRVRAGWDGHELH